VFDATADLEQVPRARLTGTDLFRQDFGGQGTNRQVSVQVLEDLQTRSWCVVSEQAVQVLEAVPYRAGRGTR
jgi:hypothetical protein